MTKNIKSKISATVIAVAIATVGGITVSGFVATTPAFAQTKKIQKTKIPQTLRRTVRKQTQNKQFMSQARGAGDELDECMSNPDNSHIEYTERLASCFCLSIDNGLKGCQTAD